MVTSIEMSFHIRAGLRMLDFPGSANPLAASDRRGYAGFGDQEPRLFFYSSANTLWSRGEENGTPYTEDECICA